MEGIYYEVIKNPAIDLSITGLLLNNDGLLFVKHCYSLSVVIN
ncbi:protein of unknown function [Moritella yayanosii]|uniref:Uncharacterized protein n=1 Tax=Moritella yayanosii TaxID=69539 RepID=A0A330LUM5_9GAMM|nr:protein of unknown function [Moritella yayanosii]